MRSQQKGKAKGSIKANSTTRKAVFRRLVQLIESSGLSDNAFAKAHGLSGTTPGKWREGAVGGDGSFPSGEMLGHLASHGYSPLWLLTGQGPRETTRVVQADTIAEALARYIAGEIEHRLWEKRVRHAGIAINPEGAIEWLIEQAMIEAQQWIDYASVAPLVEGYRQLTYADRNNKLAALADQEPELVNSLRAMVQMHQGLSVPLGKMVSNIKAPKGTRIVTGMTHPEVQDSLTE